MILSYCSRVLISSVMFFQKSIFYRNCPCERERRVILNLFFAATIVVPCFLSSLVRSLQFLHFSSILIPFDLRSPLCSRQIIMLEFSFPYLCLKRGWVHSFYIKYAVSPCSGTTYFLFFSSRTVSTLVVRVMGVGVSTEISISSLSLGLIRIVSFHPCHCIHTSYVWW